MVFGTCHHAVAGSRRDRAVEARREHRRGPGVGTEPGWSDQLAALAAATGVVTYHLMASGPTGGTPAAARKPAVSMHKAARTHPAPANTPASPAARPGSREVVISLTAVNEACWADLTTPGGATIFQGILGPGTSKTWTQRRAVTLELGNPGAVTLTVDGKTRTGLGPDPVTLRLAPGKKTSG